MNSNEKKQRAKQLEASLHQFHSQTIPLLGVINIGQMQSFVSQLIDSLQRVNYIYTIRNRPISINRADPRNPLFDPIKAAIAMSKTQPEESFWLIFLATHCGRNRVAGWKLVTELYGASEPSPWTWTSVLAAPHTYIDWIGEHHNTFNGKFGNHRKYESLKPGAAGTPAVIASYVNWIRFYGSHLNMITQAQDKVKADPRRTFALLYRQMGKVLRFGRTARFDYLTMLAKVGLAAIDADSIYLNGATGPMRGARLLFDGAIKSNTAARTLEEQVVMLERQLGVGMQVMEDALCNWQKSPQHYVRFRG